MADSRRPWPVLVLTVAVGVAFALFADLRPHVDDDFFFAADNPEYEEDAQINRLFPSDHQVLLHMPGAVDDAYLQALRTLGDSLQALPGVTGVASVLHSADGLEDTRESPVWSRLLLLPEDKGTQLIVTVEGKGSGPLIAAIERHVEAARQAGLEIGLSGIPYIMELIRRHIVSDFLRFSGGALLLFLLVITLIFRSLPIVLGTLSAALVAIAGTLLGQQLIGMRIGVLTANVATIVFVLTLSHIVFLTSNWRRVARLGSTEPARAARRLTVGASVWCMITTLLGFLSLLFAAAKPLRELAISGAIGTVLAFLCAFLMFPRFLAWAKAPATKLDTAAEARAWQKRGALNAALLVAGCALAALGTAWLDTDPSLLDYFREGGEVYEGLLGVDRDGGSTSLNLVVNPDLPIDERDGLAALTALVEQLETDPAVGTGLSIATIVAEAWRTPVARMIPPSLLLRQLESPTYDEIATGYVSGDRELALIWLRMHEADRETPRGEVVARLRAVCEEQGFPIVMQGGIYALQGQLGELVLQSLVRGVLILLALFALIAFVVCRSLRTATAMLVCLGLLPLGLLGVFGWGGFALDLISLPAANVCLGIAVDVMLHLVHAVRRARADGADVWEAWAQARAEQWRPICSASAIVCAGFAIFGLSNFSPTVRFGVAVVVGTAAAAALCLYVLPLLGARGPRVTASGGTAAPDR